MSTAQDPTLDHSPSKPDPCSFTARTLIRRRDIGTEGDRGSASDVSAVDQPARCELVQTQDGEA
jgi:hypothetical protein